MDSYKACFSRFFEARPGRLHVAAHSHHPWPDVSFAAHQQAWLDAATYADQKWSVILGEVMPAVQRRIAETLSLPDPTSLVFAPNTHELFVRIRSCLPAGIRVLTTDAEFHSASRQLLRWQEEGQAEVVRVPAEPFESFRDRFTTAARGGPFDLIYVSQVFFNSGFVIGDLDGLVAALPGDDSYVVIDGYHGFRAVPTDLSAVADRVFYLAGGYKYAMSGEGVCFAHCPSAYGERPVDTGWFAGFERLESAQRGVPYARDAQRFAGATVDASGLYRMAAVLDWMAREGLTVEAVQGRVRTLQARFLEGLREPRTRAATRVSLDPRTLIPPDGVERGHFLTFRTPAAPRLHEALLARGVVTDVRDDRLRFGFGIYHDLDDIDALLAHIDDVARG